MNRFNTLLIIAGLSAAVSLKGQSIHGVIGADAQMQAGISATLNNCFSVINNPSQMSWLKSWQAGVYSEQRFSKRELSLSNVSVVLPAKIIDLGFGINHYGFSDFNQQRFTLSMSKKLAQTLSLGVQVNYVLTTINEYGTSGAFVFGAGVSYQPTDKMMLGFSVYNPNQQELSSKISDKLPSYARFGIQYKVNTKVYVLAEAGQQTEQNTGLRGAIRYEPHKRVSFAVGVSTQPIIFNFGTSLKVADINIDMAAGVHPVLGVIPQLSIRFPSAITK
ncbi:MAG: hypothetical protein V4658_04480 [Bacteroidota bacterium]